MGPKTALIAVLHSASLEVLADNFALVSLKTLLFLMAPFGWRNFGFSAPSFSKEDWSNITQCATTIRCSFLFVLIGFSTRCRHICPYGEAAFRPDLDDWGGIPLVIQK